ncbi:serine protease inhibitor Kazal-type 4 [Suncus etruscus]|uniref:serine protease inhibitor Kazal-type 4 n=1 Tax=Suncus etruscus TaxID=109475 RepID=UPI002110D9E9|nr:serine protease inhibitor Kazal-type 4 [Suncus etruscus]
MAMRLGLVVLALAAFLVVERDTTVSAEKLVFSRMPICEHMTESPECVPSSSFVCGTNGVTYDSECHLCLARMKTKQDIQIVKDGKC